MSPGPRVYPHPTVTRRIPLVVNPEHPQERTVLAQFTWLRVDPLVITLWLPSGRDTVRWDLGRDLLYAGTAAPAGRGDVRVLPERCDCCLACGGGVRIILRTPSGYAELFADADAIERLVDDTYDLVPAGTEFDDVRFDDVDLVAMLGGA